MPRFRPLPVLCAALVLCAAQDALPPQARAALDSISADSLRGHVSFLASDLLEGRATPSRGLDVAAEYIAAQFRRTGLEPAGDDGYFQTADFVLCTPNLDGFELTFERDGKTLRVPVENVAVENRSAVELSRAVTEPVALTPDTPAPAVSGVGGKVVLVTLPSDVNTSFRSLFSLRASLAEMRPAAVVVLSGRRQRLRERLVEASAPDIAWVSVNSQEAREFLASGGQPRVSLHVAPARQAPVRLRNVAGLVRGSDPELRRTYVMVTAHYDHIGVSDREQGDRIYNGANDDASGTASVLELSAALAHSHPRRSILFVAFFGEERGMLGSQYYVRHPLEPLDHTVADVNLEQLGRTDDTEGPRVGSANLTGFEYSTLGEVFRHAGELTGIAVSGDPKNSDQFFGASDNLALARAGIPAHTVSVAYLFPDYHQPGDEWQKLDYDNMAKVDRMIAAGVWLVANESKTPAWNRQNPKVEQLLRNSSETR